MGLDMGVMPHTTLIGENTYSPYPGRPRVGRSTFPFSNVPRYYLNDCVWLSGE